MNKHGKASNKLIAIGASIGLSLAATTAVYAKPADVPAADQTCKFFLGEDEATVTAIAEAQGAEAFGIKVGLSVRKSKSTAMVVGYLHGHADASSKDIQKLTVAGTQDALSEYCTNNKDKTLFEAAKAL